MIPELAVRLSGCSLYPVLVRWQTIFLVPYYMCMPFLLISCLVSGLPIPWLFFFRDRFCATYLSASPSFDWETAGYIVYT